MVRFGLLVSSMCCLAIIGSQVAPPAMAQQEENATTVEPASKALRGGVKTLDIEAAETLRQLGDANKKMQRAMLELMGEATRMSYMAVGDPNVIGTLIIPALPDNMMKTGPYEPIRKKWMDYYLDQVGMLIPIYAELVDSLLMPESTRDEATKMLDQMRPLFADAKQHYDALVVMSKDLKHAHHSKIAEYAVIVHDDFMKCDKIRLDVFKLLKKSES